MSGNSIPPWMPLMMMMWMFMIMVMSMMMMMMMVHGQVGEVGYDASDNDDVDVDGCD